MKRSSSILVAAAFMAGCATGDQTVSDPVPHPQFARKHPGLIYQPTGYTPPRGTPLYHAVKPIQSYTQANGLPKSQQQAPQHQTVLRVAQPPAPIPQATVKSASAIGEQAKSPVPATKRSIQTAHASIPPVAVRSAPATHQLNYAAPRVSTAAVSKQPKIYSPFPRSKPAKPTNKPVQVANAAGLGARYTPVTSSRASTLSVPITSARSNSGRATPPIIEYHIPHLPQEEPLWCWAAAAQQAIGWVNGGRAPAQCAIVALAHGISIDKCCGDKKGVCAKTGEIPEIAALIRRFGGQAAEAAEVPRTPQEIYTILKSGSTLLVRLRPAPHDQAAGIRHMIVVRGLEWLRLPNGQLSATLHYNDPLGSGQRSVDFNEIVGFFEQALIVRRSI